MTRFGLAKDLFRCLREPSNQQRYQFVVVTQTVVTPHGRAHDAQSQCAPASDVLDMWQHYRAEHGTIPLAHGHVTQAKYSRFET